MIINFLGTDGKSFDVRCYLKRKFEFKRFMDCSSMIMDQAAEEVFKKKRKRDYNGYYPDISGNSSWYYNYVSNSDNYLKKAKIRVSFRRRFRMPHPAFVNFMSLIRYEDMFPTYENCNALGQIRVPLELLVLGSLRYLGRGWTFDDYCHRMFFKDHLSLLAPMYYLNAL